MRKTVQPGPWMLGRALATTLLLTACAGTPAPHLDELPVRSSEACGISWKDDAVAADVALVIDTSQSTARPAGTDVDEDGVVGRFTRSVMTDPGDSILAAQISATRSLLRSGLPPAARFSLVTYAGRTRFPTREPPLRLVSSDAGSVRVGLTDELRALETSLDRVLARGSRGNTDFAAALQLALRALERAPDAETGRRRLVLLLSDSPDPVVAVPNDAWTTSTQRLAYPSPRLARLARRALRSGVPVHTFGLGDAARSERPHALDSLARVTGGAFRAVDDPAELHCAMLAALVP